MSPSTEADSALGLVGEETDEDDYEEQPVLRDDDRELDRLFDVSDSAQGRLRRPSTIADLFRMSNPD